MSREPHLTACLKHTRLYTGVELATMLPNHHHHHHNNKHETVFEVTTETSLQACRRLLHLDTSAAVIATDNSTVRDVRAADDISTAEPSMSYGGSDVVALLNFASARKPGGGFLHGNSGQEESLARSSALYASLKMVPDFYRVNSFKINDGFYTDSMIWSPNVPVFRDDTMAANDLLESPYAVSMVIAPAVNAGVAERLNRSHEVEGRMRARIQYLLTLLCDKNVDTFVVGAWGCGVFRNSPEMIANLFHDQLCSAE